MEFQVLPIPQPSRKQVVIQNIRSHFIRCKERITNFAWVAAGIGLLLLAGTALSYLLRWQPCLCSENINWNTTSGETS